MLINTKHFGEVEVDQDGIILFDEGLPGFEDVRRFVLLDTSDSRSPFKWLQCTDIADLAFAVVDPFAVKADYDFDINDKTINRLEVKEAAEVIVYSIVVVPEDMTRISMNLKAPLLINKRNKKAAQVVLDSDKYSVRHYIIEELRGQEVKEDASTDKEEGPVNCNK